MDFLKLLPGLVKVFQCISHLLTNKTKLKFDQELKACRSFCFELKVLNKSNDSMPWACCAFGNVYSTIFGLLVRSKTDNTWTSLLLSALLGLHIFWFWPIGRGEGSATFQISHRQPNRCLAAPPMPSWSWCTACCWPDWPPRAKNQRRGAGWLWRCTFGDQLPPPIQCCGGRGGAVFTASHIARWLRSVKQNKDIGSIWSCPSWSWANNWFQFRFRYIWDI